jgi:hypothetical protein
MDVDAWIGETEITSRPGVVEYVILGVHVERKLKDNIQEFPGKLGLWIRWGHRADHNLG